MLFQKLTIGTAFGLVLTAAYLAAQFAVPAAAAKNPPKPPIRLVLQNTTADEPKPPAAKPTGPGRLLIWKETQHVFLTPNGKEEGTLPNHPDKRIVRDLTLSPDGTRVAFVCARRPPDRRSGTPAIPHLSSNHRRQGRREEDRGQRDERVLDRGRQVADRR